MSATAAKMNRGFPRSGMLTHNQCQFIVKPNSSWTFSKMLNPFPLSLEKNVSGDRPHFIMLSLQYAILFFLAARKTQRRSARLRLLFIFFIVLRCATNNILALAFLIYVSLHATFYILQFTYTHLLLSHITSLLFIVLNSAQSKVCKCFTISH